MLRLIEGLSYDSEQTRTYAPGISGVSTWEDDFPDGVGDWSTFLQGLGNAATTIYSQRQANKHELRMRSNGWEYNPTPFPPQMGTLPFNPNTNAGAPAPSTASNLNPNVVLGALGVLAFAFVWRK